MDYHLDVATERSVSGWCVGPSALVEARLHQDGELLGVCRQPSERFDIESVFHDKPYALKSGFTVLPDSGRLRPQRDCWLEFSFVEDPPARSERFVLASAEPESLELPPELSFPATEPAQHLLFLASMWSRFRFIERFFPRYNRSVAPGSKDENCVGSSAIELLHIANHVYRLKELGLRGSLCEFGCFKGFSTACLSHVCSELGLTLECFDSFAGLPSSGSSYYQPSDFRGTLEEVCENVGRFGRLSSVRFNRGFFADTLPGRELEPILIWMDVDLHSSSRDVMVALAQLPRESCVFSHECFQRSFQGESIRPLGGEGDIISPILEAMEGLSRRVSGRWLIGCLGAFWDRDVALPPVSQRVLQEALAVATSRPQEPAG